jgi:uncharacterized protein (DUF433 family)
VVSGGANPVRGSNKNAIHRNIAKAVEVRENIVEDMRMGKTIDQAWADCDLVERIPGKQGGVPVVKGTRIPAAQIIEEAQMGSPIAEIAENYPSTTREQIAALIAYADQHKSQLAL